jgi:hypothetical protein
VSVIRCSVNVVAFLVFRVAGHRPLPLVRMRVIGEALFNKNAVVFIVVVRRGTVVGRDTSGFR